MPSWSARETIRLVAAPLSSRSRYSPTGSHDQACSSAARLAIAMVVGATRGWATIPYPPGIGRGHHVDDVPWNGPVDHRCSDADSSDSRLLNVQMGVNEARDVGDWG